MTTIHFSKKPGAYMKDRQANLESHDTVIGTVASQEPSKQLDLSHLRPDKHIRGD